MKNVILFLVTLKRELYWLYHNKIYYKFSRKKREFRHLRSNNVKVCFILQRTEIFSSVQTLFDKCCSRENFEVTVLVLPRYDHGKRCIDIASLENNLVFCDSIIGNFNILNPYNKNLGEFIDLEENKFDFIFLGLPYEKQYPPKYSFAYLSKLGRLCYVPYGSYYADGLKMIRFGFPNELLKHIDYVFADGENVYNFVNSRLCLCKNNDNKQITYNVGYPRFDLISSKKNEKINNTFLWLPRWTLKDDNNESSSFMDYKDKFLEFFSKHKEFSLIIRPHPALFENYIANGIMSESEVSEFKEIINQNENIFLDTSTSYIDSFIKADFLIADYTSLAIEFLLSDRPVIYLGRTNYISSNIKSAFYLCTSFDSIKETIHGLIIKDELSEARNKVLIDKKYQKGAAERIIDILTK